MSGGLEQIVGEALERGAGERARFLEEACRGDAGLRREAESLIRAHDEAGEFFAEPTRLNGGRNGDLSNSNLIVDDAVGGQVGPYRLIQRLGEGGFGVVYMAEQESPVRRRVAVKLIKPGVDTRQVIARFEAERRALAMMDHPNIAKVLDAGTTDAGRPYFVMELVHGTPITSFCKQERLNVRQRLDLFIDVCHAVQHAHTKRVIHRDIKPSNVLVAMHDGKPLAKVIDFGIVKALDRPLTERTCFTESRQLIGTPEYMSPEQARMGAIDIDTRSDVYSLGVLLYELLTGVTPFDREMLKRSSFDEMRRMICETEPDRPSARLARLSRTDHESSFDRSRQRGGQIHMAAGSSAIDMLGPSSPCEEARATADDSGAAGFPTRKSARAAASRFGSSPAVQACSDVKALSRLVRGDLDWIVMKCLEKDRSRRYETARELAMDVGRHLSGEPVLAAPPSRAYRWRKALRRHRVACAFLIVLGGAALSLAFLWQRAAGQRDKAEAHAELAAQVLELLSPIEAQLFSRQQLANARERLDRFRILADETLRGDPRLEACVRHYMVQLYLRMGERMLADQEAAKALAAARRAYGEKSEGLTQALGAAAHTRSLRGDLEGAERLYREAADIYRRIGAEDDPRSIEFAGRLAHLLRERGDAAAHESAVREILARFERSERPENARLAMKTFAEFLADDVQRYDEARLFQQRALDLARQYDDDDGIAHHLHSFACLLLKMGDLEAAERLQRECLDLRERVYADDHPHDYYIYVSKIVLGKIVAGQNRFTEAQALFVEAYDNLVPASDYEVCREYPTYRRWAMEGLAALHKTWDQLEPGHGHAEAAAEWRTRLTDSEP